jgi:hypothetical protein
MISKTSGRDDNPLAKASTIAAESTPTTLPWDRFPEAGAESIEDTLVGSDHSAPEWAWNNAEEVGSAFIAWGENGELADWMDAGMSKVPPWFEACPDWYVGKKDQRWPQDGDAKEDFWYFT